MFGFSGGEPQVVVERKTGYRAGAKARWPFLTMIDLGSIKTAGQLQNMIKIRSGISDEQAKTDTAFWMRGKDFTSEGSNNDESR
ncbi:hypothetical protein [Parvularcula sp. LCG005]|uniref:hypothetical protein n=1 Tax=Parvularcula sp. LCG005 TaxID=3078805 RepID=UPI002941C391|nr:hypothetical protein [Parvularcula sp. LCG005]WOI52195.1 hypothetical protein RUI03_08515 [Parvularcula sp. LCG005]